MHLVMLYALIALAVACLCNTIAIVVLSRRLKPRGMSYQDISRTLAKMRDDNARITRMSEQYRKTFGQ